MRCRSPSRRRPRESCANSSRRRAQGLARAVRPRRVRGRRGRRAAAPARAARARADRPRRQRHAGRADRYEIFHDVLGPPILAWQAEHQLRREQIRARRQHRRLLAIIGASLVALAVVAAVAVYALVQRSDARTQARHAHGGALAGHALADIPTNPQVSVQLALQAAQLSPGRQTTDVLRSSLAAMRETRILRLGGDGHRLRGVRSARRSAPRRQQQRAGGPLRPLRSLDPSAAAAASADRGGLEPGRPALRNGCVRRQRRGLAGREQHAPARDRHDRAGHRAVVRRDHAARRERHSRPPLRLRQDAREDRPAPRRGARRRPRPDRARLRGCDEVRDVDGGGDPQRANRPRDLAPPRARDPFLRIQPGRRLLASGSYDHTARIWDARSGKRRHVLRHTGLCPRRALLLPRRLARHFEPGRRRVPLGRCHRPEEAAPRRQSGRCGRGQRRRLQPGWDRDRHRLRQPAGDDLLQPGWTLDRVARRPPRCGHEHRLRPERADHRDRLERRHRAALGSAAGGDAHRSRQAQAGAAGARLSGPERVSSASPVAKPGCSPGPVGS